MKGEGAFFNNKGTTEVSIRGSTSISVQGMRENANDFLLDGIDNNELTAGAISILPSVESIQEFKVLTNNYSAEYGSRGGGTVLVSTKSGTNELHCFPKFPVTTCRRFTQLIWPKLPRAVSGTSYLAFLAAFLRATPRMDETPIGRVTPGERTS